MISQTTEYALRAIVYLADQNGDPCTTAQIAEATQVPPGYLAKVMQQLGRAGLATAQRGLNGGFTLAVDAKKLTVLQVINAVDPIRRYHSCPLSLPSHATALCPLHRQLDEAGRMIETMFQRTTIASLLDVPPARKPLCRFPCIPEPVA